MDTSIAGPVTSTGTGSIRFDTGRNLTVNHDVIASGTGAVTLLAGTGNIIASNAGNDRNVVISTTSGRLRIGATEGSVLLRRLDAANTRNVRVQSTSGDIDITAGTAIEVRGNQGSSWARVRSESGAISMTAPDIRVIGGTGSNAFAEVVAGAGGAVTMQASRRIEVQNGAASSPGRVQALDGATLTMRAPQQIWNGFVRASGSVGPDIGTGGEVRVAGVIAADVAPIFNLGPGSDFTLEPATPGPGAATTASGYTSPVRLRVDTRGVGAITLHAPVEAAAVTLISEQRVTLAPGATVTGTGAGDAVVMGRGVVMVGAFCRNGSKSGVQGGAGRGLQAVRLGRPCQPGCQPGGHIARPRAAVGKRLQGRWVAKQCQAQQHVFALAHGQAGKGIGTGVGAVPGQGARAAALQRGRHAVAAKVQQRRGGGLVQVEHRGVQHTGGAAGGACCGPGVVGQRASGTGPRGAQQQYVVGVKHGGIGRIAVRCPHGPAVEGFECVVACLHVGKAAQPDKQVGLVQVAKLAQHAHAVGLLRFDKFAVKQVDEHVALLRVQGVLAQFDEAVGVSEGGHWGSSLG